jgi:uncharacterized protein YjbI with pentapeptide repeats
MTPPLQPTIIPVQRGITQEIINTQEITKRTPFIPATHGFHFANTFQNHRFIGPIDINIGGRCGGMVYAALDFYFSGLPIPADTSLPPEGSALSTYISKRQDDSINNTLDLWIERGVNPFGWRTAEFFHWGLPSQPNGQVGRLRSCVDIDKPVPLGLFAWGNAGVSGHHQVSAIGYELGARDEDLRIFIYDPNYPGAECVIQPDIPRVRYFETSPGGTHEWLTYFADLNYRPQRPNLVDPCADKAFRDWSGQNQTGRNYSQQDLACSRFIGTDFSGSTMMQTDFSRVQAQGANFHGANLRNSNFSNALLQGATFLGADLKSASLVAVSAIKANFLGSDLQTATLENGVFESADFYGANLENTILKGADFRYANFYGADLRNANLDNANFTGAIMTGGRPRRDLPSRHNRAFKELAQPQRGSCAVLLNIVR